MQTNVVTPQSGSRIADKPSHLSRLALFSSSTYHLFRSLIASIARPRPRTPRTVRSRRRRDTRRRSERPRLCEYH